MFPVLLQYFHRRGTETRRWELEHGLTQTPRQLKIGEVLPESGPVAQLGARFHGMEEVIGSIPIRSTKHISSEINDN